MLSSGGAPGALFEPLPEPGSADANLRAVRTRCQVQLISSVSGNKTDRMREVLASPKEVIAILGARDECLEAFHVAFVALAVFF
jgi:hypothetical protein